jgi:uncharacterized protein YxjI
MGFAEEILKQSVLLVEQKRELVELVGFETRNQYAITTQGGAVLALAAEQQFGVMGFLMRQALGHWRKFDISILDVAGKPLLVAHHPFRWIFQRLEVSSAEGRPLGALQQRFSLLSKRFDVEDATGTVRMTVSSPLWRIWTFPFTKGGREVAVVAKKWGGLLTESFLDKDRFRVEYQDTRLTAEERQLILAAALFIDLQYFERKAG